MQEIIKQAYSDFISENNLEDNGAAIDLFITSMYYEILDNLEIECENFCVPKELEGIQAQEYIEGEIRKIIQEY